MATSGARVLLRLPRDRALHLRLASHAAPALGWGCRDASYAASAPVTLVNRRCPASKRASRGGLASFLRQRTSASGHLLRQGTRGLASGVDYTMVNMPALSPTMEAGTITQWHKAPGDELAAGDVLCDVETDKATVAFDVQDDGVLAKIIAEAGSGEVSVGTPVAVFVDDTAAYEAFVKADAAGQVVLGGDADTAGAAPADEAPAEEPQAAAAAGEGGASTGEGEGPQRTVAEEFLFAPAARHMAQSKGIDASSLQGTGKGGRITKGDILAALGRGVDFPSMAAGAEPVSDKASAQVSAGTPAAGSAAPSPAAARAPPTAAVASSTATPPTTDDYVDHPANNIKKVTAKRLTQSKAEVPHLYVSMGCEVDALMALRKTLQKEHDVKVSVNDIIIRSAALALRDVPEANAMWTGGERRSGESIDISVAVATPTGLITPIVTGANERGLSNISSTVRDLATRARDRLLKPEQFQGGSFTVSNLGMFGINEFSAVINMPQACILAVGGGSPKVKPGKALGEKPRICSEVTVRLSADRRVVDEAIAAQLLQSFKHYMEKPELLLM